MTTLRKLTTVMELEISDVVDGVNQVKKVTKQATVTTSQSADAIKRSWSSVGKVVKVSEDKIASAKHAVTQHQKAINKAERELTRYSQQVKLSSTLVGKSALEQEIAAKQFMLGAGATDEQRKAIADLVREQHRLDAANRKTGGSFRMIRNSSAQMGHQVQDIAVQAQMGTDAFIILGQQGSQIASLFGAGGAAFGAVLAISAALSGVLYKAVTGTSDVVKDFKADIDGLAGSLDKLTELSPTQMAATFLESSKRLEELGSESEQSGRRLRDIQKILKQGFEVEEIGDKFARQSIEVELTSKRMRELKVELLQVKSNYDEVTKAQADQLRIQNEINRIRRGQATTSEIKETNEVIKALRLKVEQYGMSKREIALDNAERRKALNTEIETIAALYENIEALEAKTDADKKAADELVAQQEASKKYTDTLRQEAYVLSLTEEQKLEYIAATNASGAANYREIISLTQLIKQRKQAVEDEKERVKLIESLTNTGRLAKLEKQYTKERELLKGNQEALTELERRYNTERIKISGTAWERYVVATQESLMDIDTMVTNSVENFTSGFGNAFATAIFESQSLGDAMQNLFTNVGKNMVAFFAEWAAQKLMLWALDQTISTASQTSAATTTTANAQSASLLAGIQAYQSAAAIPYVGWTMAPAAMASALAVTQPMAAAASSVAFAGVMDKGGQIPSGSAAIVSEIGDELVGGTMVYNGSSNSLKVTGREETARMRGGNTSNSVTINSSGSASPEAIARAVARMLKKPNKQVDNAVYDSMNRGRRNRGKRFNA